VARLRHDLCGHQAVVGQEIDMAVSMAKLKYWLWGVAELADWHMWRPRWFWRWLIKKMDRAHGWYHMDHEYD
jgi:hypothetical protein